MPSWKMGRNPAVIPIWIVNRNSLTWMKNLVGYLLGVPDVVPLVYDCNSTWEPLLEWYNTQTGVEVIRSDVNGGARGCWSQRNINRGSKFYGVTSHDLDLSSVPVDFVDLLQDGLIKYPWAIKAGLSLEIDDLPDTPCRSQIVEWESQFWTDPIGPKWYRANVDTTMALYRAGTGWKGYGPSLRSNRPYTARHLPWYITPDSVTDEDRYYADHAVITSRWMKQWAFPA